MTVFSQATSAVPGMMSTEEGGPETVRGREIPAGSAGDTESLRRKEVEVKFITGLEDPKYDLGSESALVIPSSLDRAGLSELLNSVLGLSEQFDFLVKDEFLRTPLQKYMDLNRMTAENILEIEYILAKLPPKTKEVGEARDWISSVCSTGNFVITGSYDGYSRCYRGTEFECEMASPGLNSVTAVAGVESGASDVLTTMQGLKNGEITFWRGSGSAQSSSSPLLVASASGHEGGVSSLSCMSNDSIIASGGEDAKIKFWRALTIDQVQPPCSADRKRRKPQTMFPVMTISEHTDIVTTVDFPSNPAFKFNLLSGSLDRSICCCDVITGETVGKWTATRAVMSISAAPTSRRICSSHEDGKVLVWDLNQKNASTHDIHLIPHTYNVHRRIVSSCRWNPVDENCIASVSHDGMIRVMDLRSLKLPIQSVSAKNEKGSPVKLLACVWVGEKHLVSGGDDGVLRLHAID